MENRLSDGEQGGELDGEQESDGWVCLAGLRGG